MALPWVFLLALLPPIRSSSLSYKHFRCSSSSPLSGVLYSCARLWMIRASQSHPSEGPGGAPHPLFTKARLPHLQLSTGFPGVTPVHVTLCGMWYFPFPGCEYKEWISVGHFHLFSVRHCVFGHLRVNRRQGAQIFNCRLAIFWYI